MTQTIFVKLKRKIAIKKGQTIHIQDVAEVSAAELSLKKLAKISLIETKKETSETYILIDQLDVIELLKKHLPNSVVELLGASATLVELRDAEKKGSLPLFLFVWSLLFVGAGLTIMYFHEEIGAPPAYNTAIKVNKNELELAKTLIASMSGKFAPP